jgi:hypothetical protein
MSETPASTVDVRGLADALTTAFPSLGITDRRIAIATYRLLARGIPASVAEIAFAPDVTPDDVDAAQCLAGGIS